MLYLGRPRESVIAEAYRHLVDPIEHMRPELVPPRLLLTVRVRLERVVDLRPSEALDAVGLDAGALSGPHGRCRRIAAVAHAAGMGAILAPSASGLGETLAVFTDREFTAELLGEELWRSCRPIRASSARGAPRARRGPTLRAMWGEERSPKVAEAGPRRHAGFERRRGREGAPVYTTKAEARMELIHLRLDEIEARHNPRRLADVAAIKRLAISIARVGLEQPLLVSRERDGHVLVAGGRRLEAVRELGWEEAPASSCATTSPTCAGPAPGPRTGAGRARSDRGGRRAGRAHGRARPDARGGREAVGISVQTARERRLPPLSRLTWVLTIIRLHHHVVARSARALLESRPVRAAYADSLHSDDPLAGLVVAERPDPDPPAGWTTVEVRAASLNHHDLWSLRGVGLGEDRLPMILGCDAAGVDPDGNEVIVHALIGGDDWRGDETLDPRRTLLSELHQGALAERVAVPRRNLVAKPQALSFEQAACLPTAWLTAYRMLFVKAELRPGQTVLVQGAGGGVGTAAIALAHQAGIRVWVTSRDEAKRERALELGADAAFESGARLPERVDAVLETVGEATWGHSLRALRPGGAIVVSGATSGAAPPAELRRVFFLQLRVLGSTMGTREELEQLVRLCETSGLRPTVDRVLALDEARAGFAAMAAGELFGKIVFRP